jgi:hypothetical protein
MIREENDSPLQILYKSQNLPFIDNASLTAFAVPIKVGFVILQAGLNVDN